MQFTLRTVVKILSPISIGTVLVTTSFLVPNSTHAQNVDALRSCINSLMYKPRTYPQQATGITAEAAAIACRNPAPNRTPTSPQPRGILTAPLL